MTVEQDVSDAIANDAAVIALIGTRFYATKFPDASAFPVAVYGVVNTPVEQAINDTVVAMHPLFWVEAWGATLLETVTLAAAIRAVLVKLTGVTVTIGSRRLQDAARDLYDAETFLHHRRIEARISTW